MKAQLVLETGKILDIELNDEQFKSLSCIQKPIYEMSKVELISYMRSVGVKDVDEYDKLVNNELNFKYTDYDTLLKWSEWVINLNITNKLIRMIPDLPNCIYLDCSHNSFGNLPNIPNCKYLNCSFCDLKSLPDLNYITLLCDNNRQLKRLPELLNCTHLSCCNVNLEFLPDLPNCKILICSYNNLKELPELSKCKRLYCDNNKLNKLPELVNCDLLYCNHNLLEDLPELYKCTTLVCNNNLLTKLININLNNIHIVCSNNKLNTLPDITGNCNLYFDNNPVMDLIVKLKSPFHFMYETYSQYIEKNKDKIVELVLKGEIKI